MPILKIEAEFEGPASALFAAMTDLTKTFGHRSFQDLKARSPLNIQVISTDDDQPAEPKPTNPLLLEDIKELELTVRSHNCLKRVGIETIGDLVGNTEDALKAIPNFGRPSLENVIEKLAERGLHLRES